MVMTLGCSIRQFRFTSCLCYFLALRLGTSNFTVSLGFPNCKMEDNSGTYFLGVVRIQ